MIACVLRRRKWPLSRSFAATLFEVALFQRLDRKRQTHLAESQSPLLEKKQVSASKQLLIAFLTSWCESLRRARV